MEETTASDRAPAWRAAPAHPLGRRPRVLHMGPDPATGGGMAAVVRSLIASPLAARYSFTFIPTYRQCEPLGRLLVFGGSLVRLTVGALRRGAGVVHVHSAVRGSLYRKAVVVAMAKLLRAPVILHVHAGPGDIAAFDGRIDRLTRAAFRLAFAAADRVLSVSEAGARELEHRFGATDVLVVPNAAPTVADQDGAATLEAETGVVRVLYLGGFQDRAKGGSILVDVLPALLERRPTVEVTLAGPGEPSPGVRDRLSELERVRWAGWLEPEAKERLLAACHVFVLPSFSEGAPVALLEAMAHGRSVVASAVGGVAETLTHEVDALLVSPGAPAQLLEALERVTDDPALRGRLGDAARARARSLSHAEVYAPLDALYRDLSSR